MKKQPPYFIVNRAKELREEPTPAEELLWSHVRDKRLDGFKYYRQYPIGKFIADFCCPSRKLILELDGEIHQRHQEYDKSRDRVLKDFGFRIIRMENNRILADIDAMLNDIRYYLSLS